MAINFKDILDTLKNGIKDLAENTVKEYVAEATADGKAILDDLKADLKNWITELAKGELSKDEFTDLLQGQADEIKLVALKQVGLAEIRIDQFKSDVFDLILNTVINAVIP